MNLDLLFAPAIGIVSLLAYGSLATGDLSISLATLSVLWIAAVDVRGRSA